MRRFALALTALALLALAPVAGAQSTSKLQGGLQLQPLAAGNLWKTGVLYGATMYAQVGAATRVKVLDIAIPGQQVIGQPTLAIFGCETTSTTIAPAVRAAGELGTATCTQIGTRNVREGQVLRIAVPLSLVGQYLSLQESAPLQKGGATVTGTTWVETAIYPRNPTAAGAPIADPAIYAGAPVSYLPLPWVPAPAMQQIAYTSEAWICPDKTGNTSTAPLSTIGCNRAYRNVNLNTAGQQPTATFTLGGRVHRELTEYQYLYLVGFATYDPDGPLKTQTYQIRGKAQLIRPLPAPTPTYAVNGATITATFAPMAGVSYKISASRPSTGRVVTGSCLGDATQVVCTATASGGGSWKVSVTPTGKQAVGTSATTTVAIAGAP
ncbi:MAG: hypothetical protein ACR2JV_08495 [Gaiellales bacterium]